MIDREDLVFGNYLDKSEDPILLKEIPNELDILITMGCGVKCPYILCEMREDWGLDDPDGQPIEFFRETRNIIENKVKELIKKAREDNIQ